MSFQNGKGSLHLLKIVMACRFLFFSNILNSSLPVMHTGCMHMYVISRMCEYYKLYWKNYASKINSISVMSQAISDTLWITNLNFY